MGVAESGGVEAPSGRARQRRARRGLALAIAGLTIIGVLLTSIGSEFGLVGEARASSDIDPCGFNADSSTTPVAPAGSEGDQGRYGFPLGSGPTVLQCGRRETDYTPFLPLETEVQAPDGGANPNLDGSFRTGFPYVIGPDGAEVSYNQISGSTAVKVAATDAGISLAIDALSAWLFPPVSAALALGDALLTALESLIGDYVYQAIKESEVLMSTDWDWFVPSDSASGDWYDWFTWDGFGEATPSSVAPALVNWYVYNMDDPYYQNQGPAYARVFVGLSRGPMKQGSGITSTAKFLAGARNYLASDQPPVCTPVPTCFGIPWSRPLKPAPTVSTQRFGRVGLAIRQRSAASGPMTGTSRNDEFRTGKNDNRILAGAGHDQALAGRGADRLRGGGGHDDLMSLAGADRLKGNSGNDRLQGGPGDDVSSGHSGSDSLFDAQGSDRMLAGGGDDRIVVRDQSGDDVINCGPGTDMVIADPGDRIVRVAGSSSSAATHAKVLVGAFTRAHAPRGSTCERVYSSVHMPPREPPSIGHPAGRPPGAPEPQWPVFD